MELKSGFGDPARAARRVAGLANAACPDPALWIIGLSETDGVVGVDPTEFADWHSKLIGHFSELMPAMRDFVVPTSDGQLLALVLETARAPFVVRNPSHGWPGGGPVELEVPIRIGTKVRTARREHLIRLLIPRTRTPAMEVLAGRCHVREWRDDEKGPPNLLWTASLDLYLVPRTAERIVLPTHRAVVDVRLPSGSSIEPGYRVTLEAERSFNREGIQHQSHTVRTTPHEALVDGPGMLRVKADFRTGLEATLSGPIGMHVELHVLEGTIPLVARAKLRPSESDESDRWTWALDECEVAS